MKAKIENGNLIITIQMEKPHPSKSGKTLTVASSYGIQTTTATVNGKPISIGVNAFIRK